MFAASWHVALVTLVAVAAGCEGRTGRHEQPDRVVRLAPAPLPAAARPASDAVDEKRAAVDEKRAATEAIRERLESGDLPAARRVEGECLRGAEAVWAFYAERSFVPVWSTSDGRDRVGSLLEGLAEAAGDGLDPADYHRDALVRLAAAAGAVRPPVAVVADLDVLATDAFLALANDLVAGRIDPAKIDPGWPAAPVATGSDQATAALRRALLSGAVRETLASLRPPSLAYAALRTELARVRAVLAAPPSTEPAPETSGAAPPLDRAALEGRARTIAVNLERWRWLPDQLGARHLLVNLAAFRAELVEPGRAPLVMRAIVGRTYRRTPVFSSRATHVVLSPYWNVPPGIARKDILPLVRKDPGYLARMNMHVFVGWGAAAREVDPATMDWSTMTGARFNAKYWFRADPGALNPLGGVKIVFPNPYAVYVHGTSTPALFDRDVRTFSSGCIRVDDALGLAERLLGAPRWSRDEIERVIAGGVERTIALVEPVPVHVLYWTAWMDERGEVRVEEDVYARDGALATAIEASPSPRAGVCPGP